VSFSRLSLTAEERSECDKGFLSVIEALKLLAAKRYRLRVPIPPPEIEIMGGAGWVFLIVIITAIPSTFGMSRSVTMRSILFVSASFKPSPPSLASRIACPSFLEFCSIVHG
jgi:hypothetical protein